MRGGDSQTVVHWPRRGGEEGARPPRRLRKRSSIADGRGRAGDGQTVTKDRLRRGRGSAAKSERRSAPRKTVRVGTAKNRAMPSFLPPLCIAREEATSTRGRGWSLAERGSLAILAQLLCRILQQWVMPTVGPSPKSEVGITHFQLFCKFMVGRVPEKWGRCQVEQVSCGSCKSIDPPPFWGRSHSRHYPK